MTWSCSGLDFTVLNLRTLSTKFNATPIFWPIGWKEWKLSSLPDDIGLQYQSVRRVLSSVLITSIFSSSLQEHLVNLRIIFKTLSKYNMKIELDKCKFLSKEGFLRFWGTL